MGKEICQIAEITGSSFYEQDALIMLKGLDLMSFGHGACLLPQFAISDGAAVCYRAVIVWSPPEP